MDRLLLLIGACVVTLALVTAASPCRAAPGPEAAKAPLGSTEFYPSADRPVGWRGDGTGRYPGARPPITWERRVKGLVAGLRCQAAKPKDDGAAGLPMTVGDVNEWLIVGPFPVEKVTKELADPILDGEAEARPDAGEKVGANAWALHTVTMINQGTSYGRMVLDFAVAYGMLEKIARQNHPGTIEPLIAYGHSYVWSPEAGKARLRLMSSSTLKGWFNGKPVKVPGQYEPSPEVEVLKGWNNLVVKCGSSSSEWHVSAHVAPLPPYEYETKNVVWMTRMPGAGWSSPILVGDRLFVSADMALLVCLSKADGKILWVRHNGAYDSISEAERDAPALKEQVAPLAARLGALTEELVQACNAARPLQGLAPAVEAALDKKLREKGELEHKIVQELRKADKQNFKDTIQHACQSTATPASDGKYVYAVYLGSGKSDGAQTVVCYDLDGRKVWSQYLCPVEGAEHGCHSSPVIVGDRLLFGTCGKLYCFDRRTGKTLWTDRSGFTGGTSVVGTVDGTTVAFTPNSQAFRVADGKVLWGIKEPLNQCSPILADGVLFFDRSAFTFPGTLAGDVLKMDPLFKAGEKELEVPGGTGFFNSRIASPLLVDGLIYMVLEGGALVVYDVKAAKVVYRKVLEALNPRLTWVFNVGVCSSPVLAGKYIYMTDDQGQTLVLEPGREYKQLARDLFQSYTAFGDQDQFESTPVAEGGRLYFHGQHTFYCVGEGYPR